MLAAQLVATHMATMDCYKHLNRTNDRNTHANHLNQVNKLSRTYVALVEALNRHRGKGQQKVTVEHVHVHHGGQAIVGHVEHKREGGPREKGRVNPMQRRLAMLESRRCGAKTRTGTPCRSPAMPNGRCRMHGGKSTGAPKGNKNAWKHGHYSKGAKSERALLKNLLTEAASLRKLLSKSEC